MTYEEALTFIHDTRYRGGKDGIKHMRLLAERLGNPQARVPMIHVAGTNGKGSVCAYLQSMLRAAGHRVGLFTSPFLERYNERMRMDGVPIPDETLVRHTERVADAVWKLRADGVYPTEFEINTAIAFSYFAEERADIAVIEVGLGGRFDSTNIITPLIGVITTIGLDHTKLLGNTLGQIAYEKAGIAKPGVPLVLYPDAPDEVVESVSSVCREVGAPLIRLPAGCVRLMAQTAQGSVFRFAHGCFQDWQISIEIPGAHQVNNAATALCAMLALREKGWKLSDCALLKGLKRARWPGRLDWVNGTPPVLMDGAHNPQGVQALAAFLERHLSGKSIVAITGMMRDKDVDSSVKILSPHVQAVITVVPDSARAVSAQDLARLYVQQGKQALACSRLEDALRQARIWAGPDGVVVVTGSLYLTGAMRTLLAVPENALMEGGGQ